MPDPNAEALARRFHDIYERLAPSFGYETRKDTKQFDLTTPNGRLMIAVCDQILNGLDVRLAVSHLRGIIAHWDEFSDGHGFEERMDYARQYLDSADKPAPQGPA